MFVRQYLLLIQYINTVLFEEPNIHCLNKVILSLLKTSIFFFKPSGIHYIEVNVNQNLSDEILKLDFNHSREVMLFFNPLPLDIIIYIFTLRYIVIHVNLSQ